MSTSVAIDLVPEDVAESRMTAVLVMIDAGLAQLPLTPQQHVIARQMVRGTTREATAASLGIGINTVKQHVTAIYDRTGTATPIQLLRVALGWPPVAGGR